jgi:DNA polymerase-4/DNA polymerase V
MMPDQPFLLRSFPRAIVHIDGDAFFASCEQARNPTLHGKPIITGKERGIVASMSYEAKARGVTRGMRLCDVKRQCPDAIILPSDYETYSLLSQRFFAIVRRYTPDVEEYSIDECFADLTGLRRPLRLSYRQIAERIKQDVDTAFGFTFSVGLAPTKVLAKIASQWQKPSGLTVIPGPEISQFLRALPVEKVWGIGAQTTAFLAKQGVTTALALAQQPESWVRQQLSKPFVEIWQELRGQSVLPFVTADKYRERVYQSTEISGCRQDRLPLPHNPAVHQQRSGSDLFTSHGVSAGDVTRFPSRLRAVVYPTHTLPGDGGGLASFRCQRHRAARSVRRRIPRRETHASL